MRAHTRAHTHTCTTKNNKKEYPRAKPEQGETRSGMSHGRGSARQRKRPAAPDRALIRSISPFPGSTTSPTRRSSCTRTECTTCWVLAPTAGPVSVSCQFQYPPRTPPLLDYDVLLNDNGEIARPRAQSAGDELLAPEISSGVSTKRVEREKERLRKMTAKIAWRLVQRVRPPRKCQARVCPKNGQRSKVVREIDACEEIVAIKGKFMRNLISWILWERTFYILYPPAFIYIYIYLFADFNFL